MQAAVEEQHHPEARLALTEAAMVMVMVLLWTERFGSESGPDGLAAQVDRKLIGQGLGEVGEVEDGAFLTVAIDDLAAKTLRLGIGRGTAAVAVADTIGTVSADVGLETEDLAATEVEQPGGNGSAECGLDGLLDDAVASHVSLREAGWL